MENGDKQLSLRGPSLPGSLGVRVRGDWERFEEQLEGIDMRNSVGEGENVQLDFMKEESNDLCLRRDGDSFGEIGGVDMRTGHGEDSDIQFDLINKENSDSRDLNETARKFPLYMQTPKTWLPDNREGSIAPQASLSENRSVGQHSIPQFTESSQPDDINDSTEPQTLLNEDVHPIIDGESFGTIPSLKRPTTGSSDSLPNGKKFHVFFSYEMADRDWVHSVVEKMESEHGYRCSFHERDFHGGKRVIENIDEHIQWSVKTVLVLSPDFLDSPWCQFEMKQGLHASIEEARMLILPVMVRECEVPDTLRSLTYIDATPGTDWWDRFLEAVAAEEELQLTHSRNEITIRPQFENFNNHWEMTSTVNGCCGDKLSVPNTPEILTKPGIKISEADFHGIIHQLNDAMQTRGVLRLCSWMPLCPLLLWIFLFICSIVFASFFLTVYSSASVDSSYTNYLFIGLVILLVPNLLMAAYWGLFYRRNYLVRTLLLPD